MCMALMQMRKTLQGDDSHSAKLAFKCITCAFPVCPLCFRLTKGWFSLTHKLALKITETLQIAGAIPVNFGCTEPGGSREHRPDRSC